MLSPEEVEKNIQRWALFVPDAAQLLKAPCTRVKFHTNPNGALNLKTEIDGEEQYYHSLSSPEEEANDWFTQLDLTNIQVIFVHGVGLGYYYEAAKKWLREGQGHYLVFLEHDLEVIHSLLETKLGTELLHDRQVWLAYVDEQGSVLDPLASFFVVKQEVVSALNLYRTALGASVQRMKARLAFYFDRRRGIIAEYSNSGRVFFSSFFRNLLLLPTSYQANGFFGKFHGVPAIICGAGPSLAKNLEVLSTLKDRALIFAGGTAMNSLNTIGLLPHFGVGIDPNPAQYTRIIMNQAYETPFFYRNRMYHEALDLVQGQRLFSTGSGGHDIAHWFEKQLGIEGTDLSEGYNVIGFSLAIAEAMGCFPIILCGLDLAYSNNMSYCPGIVSHPLHERKTYFRTKSTDDELVSHTDINGEPILTLWKWIAESTWFSNFSKLHPRSLMINATEGGLGFEGVPNRSLQEVAENYLAKTFDFGAMIHGEIQNASMPPQVTPQAVIDRMRELQESLAKCQEACEEIQKDLQGSIKELEKQDQEPPDLVLTEKGQQALQLLEKEIGYIHLLKVFNDMHLQLHSREIFRLKVDEELLTKQEIILRKAMIQESRYGILRKTAIDNVKLIDDVLTEHEARQACLLQRIGTTTAPPLQTEMPPPEGTHEACHTYPDGTPKLVQSVKDGHLHGLSIFYSHEGKVLAKNWFVNGIQQGESRLFYNDGTLYSVQLFENGSWEGRQHFYYPDGTLKTVLNYLYGQLNGEVKLYYPNGVLKRELRFVQGKHNGIEKLWNVAGQLIIEAEFDMDRPVGIARQWYPNGQLAREVTYQKDSLKYLVRLWGEDGQPTELGRHEEYDYFDAVTRRTGALTNSLETLVNQLSPGQGDMSKLRDELTHLKELQQQLMEQTGVDTISNAELLWKNPSNQREAKQEIQRMTTDMQQQMQVLQGALTDAVARLTKQMEQPKHPPEKNEDKRN